MDFTVGIVSRNLATSSNFVKFQDSQNFTFFETCVEWLTLIHMSNGGQVKQEIKWGPCVTCVTT